MNLLIFATAFGTQYAIGALIDLYPAGAENTYEPRAYQIGFGLCLGVQVLAFLWYASGFRALRAAPSGRAQA
jgi:hypothetical protein